MGIRLLSFSRRCGGIRSRRLAKRGDPIYYFPVPFQSGEDPTKPATRDTFDYAAAAARLRARGKQCAARRRELFAAARADAGNIIRMLIEKYRPARIFQWGSLLDRHTFDENSDIDIAVEGIGSAERFFTLYGDAMHMTDFPPDLVEIEKINPLHADTIREKGKIVYERKDEDCRS